MNTDKVYSCLFSSGFNASNIWPYELCTVCPGSIYAFDHNYLQTWIPQMSKSKHVESTFSVHPQNAFNTRRMNGAFDFVSKRQNLFCRRMLWDRQLLQHSFLICAEYCLPVILLSMTFLSLWSVWLQGCLWKGVEAAKENEAWTFMANSNIPFPAVCPEYCCFTFSFQMDQTQSFQLICQFPTIACWNSFNIWIQIRCTRMRNYNVSSVTNM